MSFIRQLTASALIIELGSLLTKAPDTNVTDDVAESLVTKLRICVGGALPDNGETLWAWIAAPGASRQPDFPARVQQFTEWVRSAYVPDCRLVVDIESASAVLDGQLYEGFDADALRLLKALYEHDPPIPATRLHQLAFGKTGHQKAVARMLDRLGPPFRHFVKGQTGRGYRLELPPMGSGE